MVFSVSQQPSIWRLVILSAISAPCLKTVLKGWKTDALHTMQSTLSSEVQARSWVVENDSG